MRNGKRMEFVTTFCCVISIRNDIENAHHIAYRGDTLAPTRFAAFGTVHLKECDFVSCT